MIVHEGAAPSCRGEEVVAHRVVNDALRHLFLVPHGNRNAILRKAVQKVGRAIERIDDPQVFGVGVGIFGGTFLC